MIRAYCKGHYDQRVSNIIGYANLLYIDSKKEWVHADQYLSCKEPSINVAGYIAIMSMLDQFKKRNMQQEEKIALYSDNQMAIMQLNGKWQIKDGAYKQYATRAQQLKAELPLVKFFWIPEEQNHIAHLLAKEKISK